MAERSYRLKTNIGSDQSVNVKLSQDIDIYEILSLKIRQENLYKIHSANYGVVVGRVLANDAFGIPNAKVSIFIPLSETDSNRRGYCRCSVSVDQNSGETSGWIRKFKTEEAWTNSS